MWTHGIDRAYKAKPRTMAAYTSYIVRQGDHLEKLAHLLGFDAVKVWGDPKNADLKTLRYQG